MSQSIYKRIQFSRISDDLMADIYFATFLSNNTVDTKPVHLQKTVKKN